MTCFFRFEFLIFFFHFILKLSTVTYYCCMSALFFLIFLFDICSYTQIHAYHKCLFVNIENLFLFFEEKSFQIESVLVFFTFLNMYIYVHKLLLKMISQFHTRLLYLSVNLFIFCCYF